MAAPKPWVPKTPFFLAWIFDWVVFVGLVSGKSLPSTSSNENWRVSTLESVMSGENGWSTKTTAEHVNGTSTPPTHTHHRLNTQKWLMNYVHFVF